MRLSSPAQSFRRSRRLLPVGETLRSPAAESSRRTATARRNVTLVVFLQPPTLTLAVIVREKRDIESGSGGDSRHRKASRPRMDVDAALRELYGRLLLTVRAKALAFSPVSEPIRGPVRARLSSGYSQSPTKTNWTKRTSCVGLGSDKTFRPRINPVRSKCASVLSTTKAKSKPAAKRTCSSFLVVPPSSGRLRKARTSLSPTPASAPARQIQLISFSDRSSFSMPPREFSTGMPAEKVLSEEHDCETVSGSGSSPLPRKEVPKSELCPAAPTEEDDLGREDTVFDPGEL